MTWRKRFDRLFPPLEVKDFLTKGQNWRRMNYPDRYLHFRSDHGNKGREDLWNIFKTFDCMAGEGPNDKFWQVSSDKKYGGGTTISFYVRP